MLLEMKRFFDMANAASLCSLLFLSQVVCFPYLLYIWDFLLGDKFKGYREIIVECVFGRVVGPVCRCVLTKNGDGDWFAVKLNQLDAVVDGSPVNYVVDQFLLHCNVDTMKAERVPQETT